MEGKSNYIRKKLIFFFFIIIEGRICLENEKKKLQKLTKTHNLNWSALDM